jgi:hypothetical protein
VVHKNGEAPHDDRPTWLDDDSSKSSSFAIGVGFVVLTLVLAALGEFAIDSIPHQFVLNFGTSALQLRADISVFFAWDMAAILSMFSYFVYYWIRIFSKDGPMRLGGQDIATFGTAISSLIDGCFFCYFRFWPAWHLRLACRMQVEFVDWPMAMCFTVLTGFFLLRGTPQNIQQFSSFMSGAVAFQIIAFNVAFAFLDRFTKVISRGKTAVLLRNDGNFANDYPDFKNSWWSQWRPATPGGAQAGEPPSSL